MAQLIKAQFEKNGAVFSNGTEACNNKNSLFSEELLTATEQSNQSAMDNGILLEPIYHVWDQETFILDVCKVVSSSSLYFESKTFSSADTNAASAAAGWTYLGNIVTDI